MTNTQRARFMASIFAGLFAFLAGAEALLWLLPTPAGRVAADPDPSWPAHRSQPNRNYVHSLAWDLENAQRGRVNNFGYVAPFDYADGAEVGVVIGDSFIEGAMNPYQNMLQARLADGLAMPMSQIYNFGTPGAGLPHYLGVARLIGQRFRPKWAVVLVVEGDFAEGFSSGPGLFQWSDDGDFIRIIPEAQKSRWVKLFRESRLVNYLRGNLKFTPRALFTDGFRHDAIADCKPASLSKRDQLLLSKFVVDLPAALRLQPDHVVLAFDSDRQEIYRGADGPRCANQDALAREWLKTAAAEAGLAVVDTRDLFLRSWRETGRKLDRMPIDDHWNSLAHKIVANAVANRIRALSTTSNAQARATEVVVEATRGVQEPISVP